MLFYIQNITFLLHKHVVVDQDSRCEGRRGVRVVPVQTDVRLEGRERVRCVHELHDQRHAPGFELWTLFLQRLHG